ncbi:hypothetical protein VHP8226_02022 [Vibrio hippocampi]|uniref:Uncharacterized protein n=1 Tax=Vibrio hippocampi TaxID=654686 RepID=A0ABN8DJ92_9VIBR|nr:hypothetical protein VHP8226_02022 [Vibrio hippocampi]
MLLPILVLSILATKWRRREGMMRRDARVVIVEPRVTIVMTIAKGWNDETCHDSLTVNISITYIG